MGQAANVTNKGTALDTVITNALIVDAVAGIIKADVGIKVGCVLCYCAGYQTFLVGEGGGGRKGKSLLLPNPSPSP